MGRVAPADEVGAEVGAREGHCIGDGGEPSEDWREMGVSKAH